MRTLGEIKTDHVIEYISRCRNKVLDPSLENNTYAPLEKQNVKAIP